MIVEYGNKPVYTSVRLSEPITPVPRTEPAARQYVMQNAKCGAVASMAYQT